MPYSNHHHDLADCQKMLGQLNEYVDGELSPDLCRELERHLDECPDCQVVYDTLTKTIILYRGLGESPGSLPEGVEVRLFRKLNLPS
ncbi:MAG: zf-HC2 domain-containing protein [Ardenticatenaceae bacterium]|nr:zf-HC2 domain-containing protein [Ardenticatenaceae bacterium]